MAVERANPLSRRFLVTPRAIEMFTQGVKKGVICKELDICDKTLATILKENKEEMLQIVEGYKTEIMKKTLEPAVKSMVDDVDALEKVTNKINKIIESGKDVPNDYVAHRKSLIKDTRNKLLEKAGIIDGPRSTIIGKQNNTQVNSNIISPEVFKVAMETAPEIKMIDLSETVEGEKL